MKQKLVHLKVRKKDCTDAYREAEEIISSTEKRAKEIINSIKTKDLIRKIYRRTEFFKTIEQRNRKEYK